MNGIQYKRVKSMRKHINLIAAVLALLVTPWVYAQKPFVMNAQGNKITGDKLTCDADGNLTLTLPGGGGSSTFKVGNYRSAWLPQPVEVKKLEDASAKGKADEVLAAAPATFKAYRFLGWGGRVSYFEGMAQYDKKAFALALQLFDRGLATKDDNAQDDLNKGKALALMALKKGDEAAKVLDKLALAENDATAAFAFNARGRLYQEENKPRDAVLQYLRTLLLFKPGAVTKERDEARRAVVTILKATGDARAAEFEKLP